MDCKANAFYLDGFAPRVNPEMWTKEVFGQLVRMAAPNATAATWCSAAHVRKALQDSGFVVERHPGFAFKRHMIRAQLRPHLGHSYPAKPKDPVLIVGAALPARPPLMRWHSVVWHRWSLIQFLAKA